MNHREILLDECMELRPSLEFHKKTMYVERYIRRNCVFVVAIERQ